MKLIYDEEIAKEHAIILKECRKAIFDKNQERLRTSPDFEEVTSILYPNVGKTYYLQIRVENSYFASALYKWLYSGIRYFGCKLEAIHFSKPGFSDEDKDAITKLYNKITS